MLALVCLGYLACDTAAGSRALEEAVEAHDTLCA